MVKYILKVKIKLSVACIETVCKIYIVYYFVQSCVLNIIFVLWIRFRLLHCWFYFVLILVICFRSILALLVLFCYGVSVIYKHTLCVLGIFLWVLLLPYHCYRFYVLWGTISDICDP